MEKLRRLADQAVELAQAEVAACAADQHKAHAEFEAQMTLLNQQADEAENGGKRIRRQRARFAQNYQRTPPLRERRRRLDQVFFAAEAFRRAVAAAL